MDRQAVRNKLNEYSHNLIDYIKNNDPSYLTADIIGGSKGIIPLQGSPLRLTNHPNLSPDTYPGYPQNWGATIPDSHRTCFAISMPGTSPGNCASPNSSTIVLYTDETYGKRITVFSEPSGGLFTPTLLVDGETPSIGQNTGTPTSFGVTWNIPISISAVNVNGLISSHTLTVAAGGSYVIAASWGGCVGQGMIDKHRQLVNDAKAKGLLNDSEPVLGETLAVIGYTMAAQSCESIKFIGRVSSVYANLERSVGIIGYKDIQNLQNAKAPYLDIPINNIQMSFLSLSNGLNHENASFLSSCGVLSALEAGVLKQTQALMPSLEAASTVAILDKNIIEGNNTFYITSRSSSDISLYFNTIRPILANTYSQEDLLRLDFTISDNGQITGSHTFDIAFVPRDGNQSFGDWSGAGYTILYNLGYGCGLYITGGMSGGFFGFDVPLFDEAVNFINGVDETLGVSAGIDSVKGFLNNQWDNGATMFADPVDSVSGSFVHQKTDLIIGSGQFPHALNFSRTYSSAASNNISSLGRGWSHNYDIKVSRSSIPNQSLWDGTAISAAGTIAAAHVLRDLLYGSLGDNYLEARRLTLSWIISEWFAEQLTENVVIADLPGTSVEFTKLPNEDGATEAIFVPQAGSSGLLVGTVPDANGHYTTFTYTANDQTRHYFHSVEGVQNGAILKSTYANGTVIDFEYGHTFDNEPYLTKVSNNLDRVINFEYSESKLTAINDNTGRKVLFSHDDQMNLISVSDPLQNMTTYTYDGGNRLTQIYYPSNPSIAMFTNVYDELGRVRKQANAYGQVAEFFLAGSRSELIDVLGNRRITYQNPRGRTVRDFHVMDNQAIGTVFRDSTQLDGALNLVQTEYDSLNRPTKVINPEGGAIETLYTPDLTNNVSQIVQHPKPGSTLEPLVTTMTYDPVFNKPVETIDPRGMVTRIAYDRQKGLPIAVTEDVGDPGATPPHWNTTTRYAYNNVGLPTRVIDARGTVTETKYDRFGNGVETRQDIGGLNITTKTTYSPQGDPIQTIDPRGILYRTIYDLNRRPTILITPGGSEGNTLNTLFSYTPDGLISKTQQIGPGVDATERTEYTVTGQVSVTTDANGNQVRYTYDNLDRLSSVTDAEGETIHYAYDPLGRMTEVVNFSIQQTPLEARNYSPNGNITATTDANINTTQYTFDGFDRIIELKNPLDHSTIWVYDNNANLTEMIRSFSLLRTYWDYDSFGRETKRTYSFPDINPDTHTKYNAAGDIISVNGEFISAPALPTGGQNTTKFTTTYDYTSSNDITSINFDGVNAQSPILNNDQIYSEFIYDKSNRINRQITNKNSLFALPNNNTIQNCEFNTVNQCISRFDGTTHPRQYFTYGPFRNEGLIDDEGTRIIGYNLDVNERLVHVQPSETIASYSYDGEYRRIAKGPTENSKDTFFAYGDTPDEQFSYAGDTGQIIERTVWGPLGPIAVIDKDGNRITILSDVRGSTIGALSSLDGSVATTGYLPFGESSAGGSAALGPWRFTGQRFDPDSGYYYYKSRTYDPAVGMFLQPDPLGFVDGLNLYAYVGNDPINFVDPSGLAAEGFGNYTDYVGKDIAKMYRVFERSPAEFFERAGPSLAAMTAGGSRIITGTAKVGSKITQVYSKPPFSLYDRTPTRPGAIKPNVRTDLSPNEFTNNLINSGYKITRQIDKGDDTITVLRKGKDTWTVYRRTTTQEMGAHYKGGNGSQVKYLLKPD